ncbi:histidine kinase [Subsaximicrobium wynnwilliamsii]|uniref:histidine kinase n=1 Tax=Subsaximicrobium wynnwilliamsii TaxID=291179 RepID=A0A5C6ZIT9_9FLAO|nr:histidine kinase [Subsaximicrobium wynnwilliamsii]TXD84182.1 histidine kinase [Subsaximicrobium wynnwilliamsii]TXD89803.1 histidine kinase [Subsaximicrobium wynnwilliamsii]TXE03894.1 histidine kinase [Subsaximicrobium wynnwilliamsii]
MFFIRFYLFALQEQVIKEEEIALIGYMTIVVLLLSAMVIIFFVTFQKRKNKLLLDQIAQQKAYDVEIARTQSEIQEQTLMYVGRELHDNVGQMLVLAKMQLGMLNAKVDTSLSASFQETSQMVSDSLEEVRALSKSLNSEVLLNTSLVESLQNELDRLKRLVFSSAELIIKGDQTALPNRPHELVLFRILQEFFSNSMKYSEADGIKVILDYQETQLLITASDNGVGFDIASAEKGSGLINMEHRAQLIGAQFDLKSKPNEGVLLVIAYALE